MIILQYLQSFFGDCDIKRENVSERHFKASNNISVPKTHLHYGDITFTVSAAKFFFKIRLPGKEHFP